MIEKYHPAKIEPKWQRIWEKKPLYRAVDFSKKKKKFYALVEFPYPSGSKLHIGHCFTYLILDALVRKKRMENFNVLYPMGWDAFGLPTENYAIRTGIPPVVATKRNIDFFRSQFKRLGFAYNWEREINTTDSQYYRWTQWIFIQLFKYGLAYKALTPVGWCPACKIILANEEIVGGKCERCGAEAERRQQNQWLLRITAYADRLVDDLDEVDYPDYVKAAQRNWIGRSEGAEIKFPLFLPKSPRLPRSITVFTTRPDTLFGVTAVVLAPEHTVVASLLKSKVKSPACAGRQKSKVERVRRYVQNTKQKSELERTELKEKTGVFTGLYCRNPINGEEIPIWVGDYVIATYGGGAVMVVPAHDQRDFEFAKKYKLPIKVVTLPKSPKFPKFSEVFEEDGILVNSGQFSGLSSAQARQKITAWLKKRGLGKKAVSYHLRDWIFSRQHYWGEPIPMVYCERCAKKGVTWWETGEGKKLPRLPRVPRSRELAGWFPVPEDQLPVKLPKVEKYQPPNTGESPLANVKDWVKTQCPYCRGPARRETDTMPNWAGSSWYYLAYIMRGNSKFEIRNSKLFNYWLPVDIYLGGAEHTTLHLLYSRFWHKFLFDIRVVPGKEPYAARRQHGVILGEDGGRMSKSHGNVINPEEVVKEYGADTLRIYLLFMGPYTETMPWITKGVTGCYRFLNRVWKLVLSSSSSLPSSPSLVSSLHRLIKKVSEDIDSLKFNTAIAAMMEFLNEVQADSHGLSKENWQIFLLLLAPFAPHITEELWSRLPRSPRSLRSVHLQPWPKYDLKLFKKEKVVVVVQVNAKLRDRLEVSLEEAKNKGKIIALALASPKVQKYLPRSPRLPKVIFLRGKLINFVTS